MNQFTMPALPVGRPEQRLDERHIAWRFGDYARIRADGGHWHVWFNDVQVENAVDDVYAGDWGWIHAPLPERMLIGCVRFAACFSEPCELRGQSELSLNRW